MSPATDLFVFRFSIEKDDIFMVIGRCLLILNYFVNCNLIVHSCKNSLLKLLGLSVRGYGNVFALLLILIVI